MNYITSKERAYSFTGWRPGETPLDHFDAKRWLECAHSLCVCLDLATPITEIAKAVEDDGVLHELLHLALGIEICTHNTLSEIRTEVAVLQGHMSRALKHVS